MASPPIRFLIVGPSWVGDMVMAQSLFKIIKTEHSESTIAVLAPAWSAPVLARMPEVDSSIAMPVGHGALGLRERFRLGKQLKGEFDHAIVLPGSLKSALVPWLARIPVRTGFVGEQRYGLLNDIRKLDKKALPLHVQRVAALGKRKSAEAPTLNDIPKPKLVTDEANKIAACERVGLNPNKKTLALCPGAEFGPAKQWPIPHFASVAAWGIEQGYQLIVLGSDKDTKAAQEICQRAKGTKDLTGKTSLGDAIDLMSIASHVVSNDSGLMHIAAALDSHVIAIYGSSSDDYTPPLSDDATKLSLNLSCSPCFQRTCPLGHLDCLNKIDANKVIECIK